MKNGSVSTRAIWVLLVWVLGAAPLSAQDPIGFLGDLFKNAAAVTISAHAGSLGSGALQGDGGCFVGSLCGAGAELLIDLPSSDQSGVGIELGFGASYIRGFQIPDPGVDYRGSVRNLPELAAYVSGLGSRIRGMPNSLFPYFGLSFGLSDLWNARAYDAEGLVFAVDGQTFSWSLMGGVAFDLGIPADFFMEFGRTWRRFASLDWTLPPAAGDLLPPQFPRELDLSGWRASMGFQFRIQEKNPEGSGG